MAGVVRADDFICLDPAPIVAVRWWGSYIGDPNERPDGFTGPFDISFHLSNAANHPFSLPDPPDPILIQQVQAQEVLVGQDQVADWVYPNVS